MLPQTGKISIRDVNVELRKSENSRTSLNDIDVRNLSDINDGRISLNDLKGKKKKCKVHFSIKGIYKGYQDVTIIINKDHIYRFEKTITEDTELDLELFAGDTIDTRDYSAVFGEHCYYTVDGIPDDYGITDFVVFQDHKIVCEFKSFV